MARVQSVSYTHLDVYKRQVLSKGRPKRTDLLLINKLASQPVLHTKVCYSLQLL